MKKKIIAATMAAAMCVSLAACGGSTASSSAAESTASSTAESTASSTADAASTGDEEVDLRMAWWGSQDRHDRTIKAIELYESLHPNVKIEYEYYSFDDYFTKLKTLVASDQVWDMPDNPLLTSDQNDLTAIQKCGHGSFVETQNGEWYMAHLCSRPNSARGSLLGRETALQKITWQDGWPRLACGGKIAQNAVPAPKDLPEVELPAMAEQDDFDVPALAPGYATPRTPLGDCVNLTVRPGWLRLTGQESMNSLHHVTLVARRQQEHEMQAETRMDFAPICPEQMAGFTYCYDSMNFYLLGKTCAEDGTPVLELLKSDTGVVEDVCDPVPVPDGTLDFKLTTTPDGGMAQFYYRQPQGEWQSIGPACPTDILTDEHCRGFTGAHVGVYAHDMAGLHNHADFDYLNVHFER